MENDQLYKGFRHDFLVDGTINEEVPFPIPGTTHNSDIAPVEGNEGAIVDYLNFSLQLSASRKFPFFTAANLDGALFKKASRAASWKKDTRVMQYQWG